MPNPLIEKLFHELQSSVESCSQSLFADGLPVLIYGAGNVGKDVFRVLSSRGIIITGFLDQNARAGSSWNGVPISKPNDLPPFVTDRKQTHVVVGIFNAFVEIPPIITLLKALGYEHITHFLQLHDMFPKELGDRFWLTAKSFYRGMESTISSALELWSDEISRELYLNILRFRFSMDYQVLSSPNQGTQYFDKSLPSWATPLRFVDCGAFDGDTLRQLSEKQLPVESVAAFEPDPINFHKLSQYVQGCASEFPNSVSLFPCGVDSSTSQVRFTTGQGSGSHTSSEGNAVIQCVSLDEALPTFRPNLIKMDIEGAEYNALLGARNLISKYRPGLAICVYHRAEHLWQIPLLIRQFTAGTGNYFLRTHELNAFETVFYWTP